MKYSFASALNMQNTETAPCIGKLSAHNVLRALKEKLLNKYLKERLATNAGKSSDNHINNESLKKIEQMCY